jgi:hypothetical protein
VHFVAILCMAVAMAAGWAHLLELPNKIGLSGEDYLTVQQIYRGWALLGIPGCSSSHLGGGAHLASPQCGRSFLFCAAGHSAHCSKPRGLLLVYLAGKPSDANWTVLLQEWEKLRRQWEYSHAAGAILDFTALASLLLSVISERQRAVAPPTLN